MTIRVAQVCPHYYPHLGGAETHVKAISEGLAKQGIHVEVLTTDVAGKQPTVETINDVVVKRFGCWAPNDAYYLSSGLQYYLRKHCRSYDIVHAHNYHAFPALHAVLAKKHYRLILTPYYHGTSGRRIRRLLHIPYKAVWHRELGKVDRVVCISEAEKSVLQADFHLPEEKLVVIACGINIEAIQAAPPYNIGYELILYVGRLEEYKNIQYIVRAMQYLNSGYQLYILGDGPYKAKLEQLIQTLDLGSRVKILSGLDDEELYRWYKTCAVFVSLSSLESFGITVLEALAAGKPVIASDIPAFKELAQTLPNIELIGSSGIQEAALATVISKVANNRSQDQAVSKFAFFSWDTIAERVKQTYEHLLDDRMKSA